MSGRPARIVGVAVLVVTLVGGGLWYSRRQEAVERRTSTHIRSALSRHALPNDAPAPDRRTLALARSFYQRREHRPAWTSGRGATGQARDLLEVLARADEEGLRPADYSASGLARRLETDDSAHLLANGDPRELADLDLLCTVAAFRYASDVFDGRISPRALDAEWHTTPPRDDLPAIVQDALSRGRVKKALLDLAPPHAGYRRLKQARARYAEKAAADGAHADEARLRQIELNMERWRWLPRSLGERYLVVNIPEYMLHGYEGDQHVLAMRVVVGTPSRPTPVFSDAVEFVVVNPAWHVPESIVNEELLTTLAANPDHLARKGIRIYAGPRGEREEIDPSDIDWRRVTRKPDDYTFRQDPGEHNALGRLKFVLANPFNIYLHDTPAGHLFRRQQRSFSHGCIRVEDPVGLAQHVLQGRPNTDSGSVEQLVASGETRNLTLPEPLPVHILYFTAFVDDEGELQFRDDVYGIDRELLARLGR